MIPRFRVWHTDARRMYPVHSITMNADGSLTVNATNSPVEFSPIQVSGERKNGELMLYAPLYDKNGKQICEGDIVQQFSDNNPYYRFVVKYKTGAFGYQPGEHYDFISYSQNTHFNWSKETSQSSRIEIIGNIYENPELVAVMPLWAIRFVNDVTQQ